MVNLFGVRGPPSEGATLNVERAINLGRIKATKTAERRTVDVSPELLRMLHRHLAWLKSEVLRRGWGEPAWLFPNDVGKPQDKWVVGTAFRRTLKRAGLPAFRLYDLRTHVREPPARGQRPDHLRQHAARSREPDDDAALLRELDPERRLSVGRGVGSRRCARGPRFWNQKVEPKRFADECRRASGRKNW